MGILKFLFGSDKSRTNSQGNQTDLRNKTEKVRTENRAWESDFNKMISLREKAKEFEKKGELEKAIEVYATSIKTGEISDRLNFNNYAFDIQRVIILLAKTKQTDSLKEVLRENIEKYPSQKESENWKERLLKMEKR